MFESGNRVADTLADLAAIMAGRDAAICRELTKLHEEIKRAPIAELAKQADTLETRGEFVLVIGPPPADALAMTAAGSRRPVAAALARDSVKDAVAHAVELSGRPRREVYARALELAKEISATERTMAKTEGATSRQPKLPRPSGSRRSKPGSPPRPAPPRI